MSIFFIYNDKIYKEGSGIISADNNGFKYGDGLFETMKLINNKIELKDYHFDRLFSGMKILQFNTPEYFTATYLEEKIIELCIKNNHKDARARLMIFRGDGSLEVSEDHPQYIIQSFQLANKPQLNQSDISIDVFPDAKKSCDKFSNIKSNNFLPYTMAARHAKKSKVDDCIVLNIYERVCETSIANIFIIKDEIIYTPSLTEGCIAGVVRRFIIQNLKNNFKIIEKEISVKDLENADEIFLTNSIKGIRWVGKFKNIQYKNNLVKKIRQEFIKTVV